ncbi:MAG: hypothetical protein SF162_10735, partial [bacterium]|nr:hypothetical protein [bacterium]
MTYSPEDLVWIDRIVREWDSDRESELLGDLRRQIDQIPPRLLGVSTAPITSEFDAFYLAMLRRWAALGVLRHRAVESCDALIARYAPQVIEMALRLPDWAVDLPSPPAEVLTEADARRQFVGLLIPVNRALRVIWIQTHGQHSLPQLD